MTMACEIPAREYFDSTLDDRGLSEAELDDVEHTHSSCSEKNVRFEETDGGNNNDLTYPRRRRRRR
jgi:hypothetical protein